MSFDSALSGLDELAVPRGNQNTMVAGRAQGGRDAGHALHQQHVVPHVGVVIGVGRIDQPGIGGKPGRAHAGRAAEGVHFEAGIIGENQFAGNEAGVIERP